MAVAINPQKVFGGASGVVDLQAELERQDRALCAMHDQNWSGDLFQFRLRVEL